MLGERVRYDGQHNLIDHPILKHWHNQGRLIPICPEVAGGLTTPRAPAEIQSKYPILITTDKGEDVTPAFLDGAEKALELAQSEHVCCALMKAKSPSCGNQRIHDGSFTGQLVDGAGAAAAELMRNGIPVFNEQQLDELFEFIESDNRYSA